MKTHLFPICLSLIIATVLPSFAMAQQLPYQDPSRPLDERVTDLIARMTLEEKIQQMMDRSPSIPRLQVHEYHWWNESLHGVARGGIATVFPQAIGMAATFDEPMMLRISTAISDEARAMYNAAVAQGYRKKHGGLTFWTPNINIFRDPRWGRGQETYGEDPYLTSRMGVAFVKGLQGDDPRYLKTAACAKHYAVHSGPERLRHEFDATATQKDLWETYLPAFEALVKEAHVESVMCAYNRYNGDACCAHNYLITDVLRKQWGFRGHVVSDCGAVGDLYTGHKLVPDMASAAALAVKSGVNLDCGTEYGELVDAVKRGLITEKEIDAALAELLKTRFRLGMFDPAGTNPYDALTPEVVNSEKHRTLAREAALKSIVMLKNNGVLPLKNNLSYYFITGPTAASIEALVGNYYGVNSNLTTILEGIAAAIRPGSQLQYRQGILMDRANTNPIDWTTPNTKISDANFVVLGITGLVEGEEGAAIASHHFGDMIEYNLPQHQIDFLRKIKENNDKPVIVIITGGCPMNLSEVHELADAVLMAWYPGEEGGNAVADIIFGNASPSGRLPVTFPKSLSQLPPYEDYSMKGRTYRYMTEEPLYPFGFGLSYSKVSYEAVKLSAATIKPGATVTAEVTVKNTGDREVEEVVQLYLKDQQASVAVPAMALKGFQRLSLKAGESKTVTFTITPDMMKLINDKGVAVLEKGKFTVFAGGAVPIKRSEDLGAPKPVQAEFTVK
jgi:beta-glucosidase